jgi:multidrug resistance efflux pump
LTTLPIEVRLYVAESRLARAQADLSIADDTIARLHRSNSFLAADVRSLKNKVRELEQGLERYNGQDGEAATEALFVRVPRGN